MNKKEVVKLVSSFVLGGIFVLFLIRFTPILNNSVIIKDKTRIYDKTSLNKSINKVYNSVVYIDSNKVKGTGFIYKIDNEYAYILTNEHVISDEEITIEYTNKKTSSGDVIGKDKYLDLAVIRVSKKYINQVANMGKSSDVNIGDQIFAIGNPISSNYKFTVTSGIISGLNRKVKKTIDEDIDYYLDTIQMDASVNYGNSGGPLCNVNGEVIGIVTAKQNDENVEGLGFAIPIDTVKKYLDDLEKGKEHIYPSLGIEIRDNGLGVKVVEVKKDGSSAKCLKEDDLIIEIDNEEIVDSADLRYIINKKEIGNIISITFKRNNKKEKCSIKLKGSE